MYNKYFGFSESPFENNLDHRFLFLGEDHKEVLAALLFFVKAKKSFAMVCGDVGTGKTMLINSFLKRLPETVQPVMISNPFVSSQDLLWYLAKILNIGALEGEGVLQLMDKIKNALIAARDNQNRQYILIVDEAHLLPDQALEEIRLLSNLETTEQKLLQILLVGQYELSYQLDRPEMRQLRQRINVNRFLSPLTLAETFGYIDHRLQQVGANFESTFTSKCRKLIYKMTEGVPRCINQICDSALLIAMSEGKKKVNPKILRKAEEAMRTDLILTPRSSKGSGPGVKKFSLRYALAAGTAILVLLMISFNHNILLKKLRFAYHNNSLSAESHPEVRINSPEPTAAKEMPAKAEPEPREASVDRKVETQVPNLPEPSARTILPDKHLLSAKNTDLQSIPASEIVPVSTAVSEPLPAKQGGLDHSTQVIAKAGETLMGLAARYYPENVKLGFLAIILANPKITNEDLIHPGQAIYLPLVNPLIKTIRLKDGLFYVSFGLYNTQESSEKDSSRLIKNRIRFQVTNTRGSAGNLTYRIFLGGYDAEEDLLRLLKNLDNPQEDRRKGKGGKG